MDKVRIGIIGIGGMGSAHASYLRRGEVGQAELTAVCDIRQERLDWAASALGDDIKRYSDADELMASGTVDAVMIATPHYDHPPLAIKAFSYGLNALIEKPAGVYTKQIREMNEAAVASGKVFGIMFNQRTNPIYQKVRDLVQSGELGQIKRINWIITDWYRSQSYYDSGGWRATWAGEGGGVLANQDPHQLDLWQWICGMPKRVRAFCYFGKWHDIEVEDDVTAFFEYEDGATGVFVTSTADAPGTNRFEISADRGRVVIEDRKLTFLRLRGSEREFNSSYRGGFGSPECWKCDIPIHGGTPDHPGITANWVKAILEGTPLLAPGTDGIKGVSLANAMHLSTWTDNWVNLPIDEEQYLSELHKRIESSTFVKQGSSDKVMDTKGTY